MALQRTGRALQDGAGGEAGPVGTAQADRVAEPGHRRRPQFPSVPRSGWRARCGRRRRTVVRGCWVRGARRAGPSRSAPPARCRGVCHRWSPRAAVSSRVSACSSRCVEGSPGSSAGRGRRRLPRLAAHRGAQPRGLSARGWHPRGGQEQRRRARGLQRAELQAQRVGSWARGPQRRPGITGRHDGGAPCASVASGNASSRSAIADAHAASAWCSDGVDGASSRPSRSRTPRPRPSSASSARSGAALRSAGSPVAIRQASTSRYALARRRQRERAEHERRDRGHRSRTSGAAIADGAARVPRAIASGNAIVRLASRYARRR